MHLQIRWSELEKSEALESHITEQVTHGLRHHGDQVTRVEVHLHDDNGGKHGADDKRCVIEARPAGEEPLIIETTADDLYKAVADGSRKLERALRQLVEKRRDH